MWRLKLFLCLAVTQVHLQHLDFGDVATSDIRGAGSSRIVSGWDALPGQHPHQALLRLINSNGTVRSCGGTIIHREWLLTVAHCTAGYRTVVVRAGLVEIDKPEMFMESTEIYIYPTFNVSNPMSAQVNDISMIKLPIPLKYSRNLRPIRIQLLSEAFVDYEDVIFYSSGFGRIWTNGDRPDHLQWVYLKGISNELCVGYYNERSISENSLCAVGFNITTQSICTGDNGGPLVHVSPDGEPALVALSSFVADSVRGCHSGYPGVFTRTAPFHPWFKEISGIDFENLHETNSSNPAYSSSTDYPPSDIGTSPLPSPPPSSVTYSPTTDFSASTSVSIISTISTSDPITSTSSPSSQPTTSTPLQEDNKNPEPETKDEAQSELLKELEVDVKVKYKFGTNKNLQTSNGDSNVLIK